MLEERQAAGSQNLASRTFQMLNPMLLRHLHETLALVPTVSRLFLPRYQHCPCMQAGDIRGALHELPTFGVDQKAWRALADAVEVSGSTGFRRYLGWQLFPVPNISGAQGETPRETCHMHEMEVPQAQGHCMMHSPISPSPPQHCCDK
jgi:hypothetical protein